MERQLLHTPDGVRDIYNGECEERLILRDKIHRVFKLYGYSDIQTPSLNFLMYTIGKEALYHLRICTSFLTGIIIP